MKRQFYGIILISLITVIYISYNTYFIKTEEDMVVLIQQHIVQSTFSYHVISVDYNNSQDTLDYNVSKFFEPEFTSGNSEEDVLKIFDSFKTRDMVAPPGGNSKTFQWCPQGYQATNNVSLEDYDLDCDELFNGTNRSIIDRAKHWKSPCAFNDSEMMKITENCTWLKNAFPFVWPKSETSDFPLAYVVLIARNVEQTIRLLQSIYRPWNLYCLNFDNKTSYELKRSVLNLNSCFENLILPEEFVDIYWAGYSILRATMNCMKVLNDRANAWRYVQIVSWNDFPLKTNAETVEIMQIFNGSQDTELGQGLPERFRQYHAESWVDEKRKNLKKPIPPGYLTVYKAGFAATLSREFVHFALTNPAATNYYKWCETVWAPEEQYFVTLVHNLHTGVPGGFPGSCLAYYQFENIQKPFVSRYQIWYQNCDGFILHGSCVFGVGDLHKLFNRHELIAHKVYLEFQPATYYCLSKLHFQRTFDIGINSEKLNSTFYRNLPAVRYHGLKDKSNFQC